MNRFLIPSLAVLLGSLAALPAQSGLLAPNRIIVDPIRRIGYHHRRLGRAQQTTDDLG